MTELHSTTDLVLQAIKAFWAVEGYSPSIRDIMDATGISSTSVVRYHVVRLERAGAMKRTPGVARRQSTRRLSRSGQHELPVVVRLVGFRFGFRRLGLRVVRR